MSPSNSTRRSTASSTDKKLVVLASTGAKRTAYLPDVPTVIESGIKDYDVASWNGLSVPAKTPKPVIATLNAAMKDVIPSPDIQDQSANRWAWRCAGARRKT